MPPFGESTCGRSVVRNRDVVALHPGAEITVRDTVFRGARFHAIPAADALADIDGHAPPVLGGFVFVGIRVRDGFAVHHLQRHARRARKKNELAGAFQKFAAVHAHGILLKLRAVRLVAVGARSVAGVVFRNHLGKSVGLGRIGFMTAHAQLLGWVSQPDVRSDPRCAPPPGRDKTSQARPACLPSFLIFADRRGRPRRRPGRRKRPDARQCHRARRRDSARTARSSSGRPRGGSQRTAQPRRRAPAPAAPDARTP